MGGRAVNQVRMHRAASQYLEEGGNLDMFEALDAFDRLDSGGKMPAPDVNAPPGMTVYGHSPWGPGTDWVTGDALSTDFNGQWQCWAATTCQARCNAATWARVVRQWGNQCPFCRG